MGAPASSSYTALCVGEECVEGVAGVKSVDRGHHALLAVIPSGCNLEVVVNKRTDGNVEGHTSFMVMQVQRVG